MFEYLDIHAVIVGLYSPLMKLNPQGGGLADPHYNFTKAEMVEPLSYRNEWYRGLEREVLSVSYFSNALNQKRGGEISIRNVVTPMVRFIDVHAGTVWSWFCVIGCFIELMAIFKARKDNGDNGISEFDY